jgi:dCTP deaminase
MTILSDVEIRKRIRLGELIPGGDESRIRSCHYEVSPGKIIRTGEVGNREQIVDWTHPQANQSEIETVQPGAMVWVRTRERVKMPNDVCAFWWQTNTLSRQGLMLVNASMVDPGYEGLLACLFVNFGKLPVRINPDTRVAKLIFARLDQPTAQPYQNTGADEGTYDRRIREFALNAPQTFLGVHELSATLASERASALGAITDEGKMVKEQAVQEIKAAVREAREEEVKLFQQNMQSGVVKSFGWAAVGLVLLVFVTSLLPRAQAFLQPDLRALVHGVVQDEINNRVQVTGALNPEITARLNEMAARIDSLRKP